MQRVFPATETRNRVIKSTRTKYSPVKAVKKSCKVWKYFQHKGKPAALSVPISLIKSETALANL